MKKLLVIGIIVFFIGLAFIPSFNAVSISMLENQPPYIPSNPYPDGPPVDIDVILSWDGGDPDPEDTVTYYVYFDWPNNPPEIIGPYPANQTRIEYDPDGLIYVKEYFWKVVAEDNYGLQTEGPIWSFNTIYPNHPPEAPTIKGSVIIITPEPYDYKFKAIDPDGDDVRYFIDWDDGYTQWTDYYPSGEEIIVNHTWNKVGAFLIKARANDTQGALGPWGYIKISKDEQIDGKLVDNVILQWLGTITFSDVFLAFLGLPVYFTRLHIRNNNDIGVGCEAYITLSTGNGKILCEKFYNPPYKTNPHSTDSLLLYTLHELKYYNYVWGHFDITIDYHVLEDGSSITKVFHGFLFRYGSFIYDKNGEVIS